MSGPRWRVGHDQHVLLVALAGGVPALAVALHYVWNAPFLPDTRIALSATVVGSWLLAAVAVRIMVMRPLQTLANVLGGLRHGDFAVRARGAHPDDALGLVLLEANGLAVQLREQRLGAMEATMLLRKVMDETDVVILTFDGDRRLRLANRAAERALGVPSARLLGRTAAELRMETVLEGEPQRTLENAFGGASRWELRRSTFRQAGTTHHLLVLSDVSRALREEERHVWQRLVRVVSHEINNSLAPIHSIAASLRDVLRLDPAPADRDDDLRDGLEVIATRSAALSRFMGSYARLARLPEPTPAPVDLGACVQRVAGLEVRVPVRVAPGEPVTLSADGDQLEQLLINVVRNAAEAALEAGGSMVTVGWAMHDGSVHLHVDDDGPGLPESGNLFVPFFTTKAGGTGIGLVLSRQIAEAHGGALTLANRADGRGCRAVLTLPLGGRGGADEGAGSDTMREGRDDPGRVGDVHAPS